MYLHEDGQKLTDISIRNPEFFLLQKEEWKNLIKVLQLLPVEYREPLLLRAYKDYSYQEISKILDIPLGTVKSRLFSARKIVLKKMKEHDRIKYFI